MLALFPALSPQRHKRMSHVNKCSLNLRIDPFSVIMSWGHIFGVEKLSPFNGRQGINYQQNTKSALTKWLCVLSVSGIEQ